MKRHIVTTLMWEFTEGSGGLPTKLTPVSINGIKPRITHVTVDSGQLYGLRDGFAAPTVRMRFAGFLRSGENPSTNGRLEMSMCIDGWRKRGIATSLFWYTNHELVLGLDSVRYGTKKFCATAIEDVLTMLNHLCTGNRKIMPPTIVQETYVQIKTALRERPLIKELNGHPRWISYGEFVGQEFGLNYGMFGDEIITVK